MKGALGDFNKELLVYILVERGIVFFLVRVIMREVGRVLEMIEGRFYLG